MYRNLRLSLPASVALSAFIAPAFAAAQTDAAAQAQLDSLQQQIQNLNTELQQLEQAQSQADSSSNAALTDLKRSTSDQYTDLNNQIAAAGASQSKVSLDDGHIQFSSGDGRFTAALHTLLQFDTGYYSQSLAANQLPASYGPEFGSGSNFRRVYLGLAGKVFGDWSYNANFDFGGSGGTETPGHIQSV
jgi:phosphate-selective porin OprO and OprP